MAKILKKKGIRADLILSSSAIRAAQYAEIIAEELETGKKSVVTTKKLYMADESEMLELLKSIGDEIETVILVGHNPSLTYFAERISNHEIANIPTSGIFAVELDISKWSDLDLGKGKFAFFEYPKMYY